MNSADINLGQVVYSKAGRDSGRKFIVVGIENEMFVLIADGDLRKVEKPKRKKIKHIRITEIVLERLKEKLENGDRITNAEVRKALADVM